MKLQKPLTNLTKWARQATLFVVAVLSFAAMPAVAEDSIRIGAVKSVTGPASYIGEPQKNSLELMVEQVNQEGGVLGRRLELVLYDDATSPERAGTMMQRLLTQDRVSVVIGGSLTPTTLAMETLASRHGVPMISQAGSRVVVSPIRKWLFVNPESEEMVANKTFAHMVKKGISKVALLSSSAGFGRAARQTYSELAAEYEGIEVVMDETYAKGDSDMTAQLTRIRGNSDVEAIILLDVGNEPAIIARNHAALDLDVPLYSTHGLAAPEFPELAGRAADGMRMPTPAMLVAEQLPQGSSERELGMAFRKLYQNRYGRPPNSFAGYSHDALLLVVDAIRRAGSTDPAAIRDALEQTRDLVGVSRSYTFGPDNHGGLYEESGMRIVEIRNGGFVLVD